MIGLDWIRFGWMNKVINHLFLFFVQIVKLGINWLGGILSALYIMSL